MRSDPARIAFIGLGNMGSGMAANLAKASPVVAFDSDADALARAASLNVMAASSASEAALDATVVITMLPTGPIMRSVYEEAVLPVARPGALLIDCSTVDVGAARDVAFKAAQRGLVMVDAPVSGGVAAARSGTLTFMVGGSAEAFGMAEPVLNRMGGTVIHAGEAGTGQAAKICNNMLLGASMAATAEAFVLAQALGLDVQTFFDISSKASGQCWAMTSYCPMPGPVPSAPSNHGYEGGFASALMLKDLRLAVEAARSVNATVPMGTEAEALYASLVSSGGGAKDFSVVLKLIDRSWGRPQ